MYGENETAMERNEAVLNEFNAELYLTEANDEIPGNCKYLLTLTQGPQNQKQTNTGGLAKLLKLKIGVKIMLTVNRDIQDWLSNNETETIRHIEFVQDSAPKVYVKFSDKQAGSKSMRSFYLDRQNSWVPIEKCETEISIKKRSALPSIKRTQFLLTLAWASTIHKIQGLSLEQGVVNFDLRNQKSFQAAQMYTAFSRIRTCDNLYCIEEFKKSAIKVNKDALLKYGRLKQNDFFPQQKEMLFQAIQLQFLFIMLDHFQDM